MPIATQAIGLKGNVRVGLLYVPVLLGAVATQMEAKLDIDNSVIPSNCLGPTHRMTKSRFNQ